MSTHSLPQISSDVHQRLNLRSNSHSAGHRAVGTRNPSLGIQAYVSTRTLDSVQDDPDLALQKRRRKQLRLAQSLRYRWTEPARQAALEAGKKPTKERFLKCQRDLIPRGDGWITGYRSNGRGSFGGLISCGNRFCPVCAPKRAERDFQELTVLLSQAVELDLFPVFIVETVAHDRSETCTEVRAHVQKIRKMVFEGRWWTEFSAEWGLVAYITMWETLFGRNGHHAHANDVRLSTFDLTASQVEHMNVQLKERWQACARKAGLDASFEHGIEVKSGHAALAEYLSKYGRDPVAKTWSLEAEVTKGHVKRGRMDGFTPFELLDVCLGDRAALERFSLLMGIEDTDHLKKIAQRAYCEVLDAFGGKKQAFHMTDDLKERLDFETAMRFYQDVVSPRPERVEVLKIEYPEYCEKVMGKTPAADLSGELAYLMGKATRSELLTWLKENGIRAVVLLPDDTPSPAAAAPSAEQSALPGLGGNLIRANDLWKHGF